MCTDIYRSQQQIMFRKENNTHNVFFRGHKLGMGTERNDFIYLPLVLHSTFLCLCIEKHSNFVFFSALFYLVRAQNEKLKEVQKIFTSFLVSKDLFMYKQNKDIDE